MPRPTAAPRQLRALTVLLVAVGIACMALGPLMLVWPAGWRWDPHQPLYEQMMVGVYFVLGIFLLRAARAPLHNLSIIWFAVWSSAAHGAIMLVQALSNAEHRGHLIGDVPALFIAAAALAALTPRRNSEEAR